MVAVTCQISFIDKTIVIEDRSVARDWIGGDHKGVSKEVGVIELLCILVTMVTEPHTLSVCCMKS